MVHFPSIAVTPTGEPAEKSWWAYTLLGVAFLVAGALALGDLVFTTAVSARLTGWAIVIAGVCGVIHALSARAWTGFTFDVLLGLLYIAGGAVLLANPVHLSMKQTLALGLIWILSGVLRVVMANGMPKGSRAFFLSGAIGILSGIVIMLQWPSSMLWALGLFLGVDLVILGMAWLAYSFLVLSGWESSSA